jgi:hypothetical protein
MSFTIYNLIIAGVCFINAFFIIDKRFFHFNQDLLHRLNLDRPAFNAEPTIKTNLLNLFYSEGRYMFRLPLTFINLFAIILLLVFG